MNPVSLLQLKMGASVSTQLNDSGRMKLAWRSCSSGWVHHVDPSSAGSERNPPIPDVKVDRRPVVVEGDSPGEMESRARATGELGGHVARINEKVVWSGVRSWKGMDSLE